MAQLKGSSGELPGKIIRSVVTQMVGDKPEYQIVWDSGTARAYVEWRTGAWNMPLVGVTLKKAAFWMEYIEPSEANKIGPKRIDGGYTNEWYELTSQDAIARLVADGNRILADWQKRARELDLDDTLDVAAE